MEEQAAFLVVSSGIKPFFAPKMDSVFYHSSVKYIFRTVIFGTAPDGRLMLLYLKVEFVVVKKGDPVPSLWSWWLKLEAGSEIVFKGG